MCNDNPCEVCNCNKINKFINESIFEDIGFTIISENNQQQRSKKNPKLLLKDFNWKHFKNKKIYIKLTKGIPSDIGWRISKFLSKSVSHHDIQKSNSFIKTLQKYSDYKSNSKLDTNRPLFFRNYEKEDCEYFEKLFSESINPIIVSSYIIDFRWLNKFDYIILSKAISNEDLEKIYNKYFGDVNKKLFEKIYKKLKNIFVLDTVNCKIYNI